MKKSKIIAAGLALSMMLAVAACSSKEATETTAEATTSEETTTEETTTEETTVEETTTEEETEATSEDAEETNAYGLPVVKADDFNDETIKNLITENETSGQYLLMPMSYEDIDVEGYEEGIAAVDMSNYSDTILMLKFDTVDNAKTFIQEFVDDAGVDIEYSEGADGEILFTATVTGDVQSTMDGSINADGLMTLTEKVSETVGDTEAVAVSE